MTRPIGGTLLTALTASPRKGAECLVLEAETGAVAGFTTWDRPLAVDLTSDGGPSVSCSGGMNLSTITLAVGLDASFAEVDGPVGPVLTQAQLTGGKWTDAKAWLVKVSPGVAGPSGHDWAPLLHGRVREVRVEDHRWTLEIRNQADNLNQALERTVTAFCRAELGDGDCGFDLVPVPCTITAVTDAMRFSVSYAGTYVDDFFNAGKVEFTSGALDGVVSKNLFDFVSGGAGAGSLVLFEPLSEAPEVGDTLDLSFGCPKTRAACMAIQGNARRFRGFPDVPGQDVFLYPNVPG